MLNDNYKKLFNYRLLGLHINLQNSVFEFFSNMLAYVIETAKKQGRYDMGVLGMQDLNL